MHMLDLKFLLIFFAGSIDFVDDINKDLQALLGGAFYKLDL